MTAARRAVRYNGVEMAEVWPARIEASQNVPHYTEKGIKYPRIRYGDDDPRWDESPCHDCGVVKGQLHVVGGCEHEKCPECGVFFSEYHQCQFDELRDQADAVADERATSFKGTLIRWLGFVLFIAAVLALLRAAR